MIVIDENIHDHRIVSAIRSWYRGKVISITELRPDSSIKDEAIPALLHTATQPTFITLNASDFWRKIQPHRGYCVIVFDMPKEQAHRIPNLLRELLRLPHLKTKAKRMGMIVRFRANRIEYYEADRHVRTISSPVQE